MEFENELPECAAPVEVKAPENVFLGLIGALIGAILGGASIILLSQMGYIASISGVILAFCTLMGYRLLGKQLSTKGIVICVILMLITPFAADWIDWAIYLMKDYPEYGLTLPDACIAMVGLMAEGYMDLAEYFKNLGMIYLFVALGAVGTLKKQIRK